MSDTDSTPQPATEDLMEKLMESFAVAKAARKRPVTPPTPTSSPEGEG